MNMLHFAPLAGWQLFSPGRVELVFEAEVGTEAWTAAICFAEAFANRAVDGEVFEELVLETDVGGKAVGFASFFTADEVDFRKELRAFCDLVLLRKGQQPDVVFGGFDSAKLGVG